MSKLPGMGGATRVDLDHVSRAQLEAFGKPILRARIPALGIDSLLSPRDQNGGMTTWEAAEGYTFTFRGGVLVETRGLGPDLMSALVPSTAEIASGSATKRSYFYTWEEDANQRRDYACTSLGMGQERLEVYGRAHVTRHIVETCSRDGGQLSNEFWFEGNSLRQSRQWISPKAGSGVFLWVID
ncbi:YjbF family lipoprotein [Xinfangfangia sp. CPCC 101601]|uniref:YjbF family lipoprotein n=1 Tax=Pseudogemmobacter lacusdianii TaxID=3069608 RepID=A0ABU0VV59_9RHOB|nr:YjbF family lipoprotein [Xinfangfangia sp. CPCC 101601]MDQ2065140.1 YjbF family lipoprotein [Xinfangfangia sp. CPCC 101601]